MNTQGLREAGIASANRRLPPSQEHQTRLISLNCDSHDDRVFRQEFQAHAPLHIDEQGLEIEILIRRVPQKPSLSPGTKRADQTGKLGTGVSKDIFGTVRAIHALDGAGKHQRL